MLHQNSSIALQMPPYPVEQAERLNVLAYRSVAVPPPSESDLQALVRTAQARNSVLGLTGVLLYDNGTFFQWLEGPEEGLSRVWSSIQHDPRHCDVTVLRDEPISDRVFEGWALKFAKAVGSTLRRRLPPWTPANGLLVCSAGPSLCSTAP